MTSSSNLPNGTTTYSSTLTAGTPDSVVFPDRYGYVTVTNLGTDALYMRGDGQAAAVAGDGCYVVPPGETHMLANALPTWYPSSKVIPAGSIAYGGGNTVDSPASPGIVTPMESLAGLMANPGSSVSLVSSGASPYTVATAG
jgi:hypothetical protein